MKSHAFLAVSYAGAQAMCYLKLKKVTPDANSAAPISIARNSTFFILCLIFMSIISTMINRIIAQYCERNPVMLLIIASIREPPYRIIFLLFIGIVEELRYFHCLQYSEDRIAWQS
jgi:hypothetical protein